MIRVLRIIEYTYPSAEAAERSMQNWLHPAVGTRDYGNGNIVRSTIIQDLNFESKDSGQSHGPLAETPDDVINDFGDHPDHPENRT